MDALINKLHCCFPGVKISQERVILTTWNGVTFLELI